MMDASVIESESIDIQVSDDLVSGCPSETSLTLWAQAAVQTKNDAGMTIRVVDKTEMQQSNLQWRGQDKPTNVLSFAAEFPPQAGVDYLGDILICAEVLEQESIEQGKALHDHWAHIVVHGVLHLQGFDHQNEEDAQRMEQRERQILTTLGIANPYRNDV